jgi:plasmid stabilization system protein ParE
MTYKLEISKRAKEDRDAAFDWYCSNYSEEFAIRWYDGISRAIESLTDNPHVCHKAHENVRFPFDLLELLYGTRLNKHRILFTVEHDRVLVLHIRHSAQQDLTEDDL